MKNKNLYQSIKFFTIAACMAVLAMAAPNSTKAYTIHPYDNSNTLGIPQKVIKHAQEKVADAVETVLEDENSGVNLDDNSEIYFSKPYVICNALENQDAIYNFPLAADGRIAMVLSVMDTEDGLMIQFGKDLADKLNEISYIHTDYVFYEYEDTFYAESASSKIVIGYFPEGSYNYTEEEEQNSRIFSKLSYTEKRSVMAEKVADFVPCTEPEEKPMEEMKIGGSLTLHNPMGQYNYNMCWAACVATVVNYKQKASLNPFEVCLKMAVPYDAGGTIFNIRDALNAYGVAYSKVRYDMLSWSEIKDNIDNSHPIIALLKHDSSDIGHSVVIYGYAVSGKYIYFWDPELGNTGMEGSTTYTNADSKFMVRKEKSYAWEQTVSKK